MARPVAAPLPAAGPVETLRAAGVGVTLLLAIFVACPVAALLVHGLPTPVSLWPWAIAARTVAVALTSAVVTFGLAALVGITLMRIDAPGRVVLYRIYELGVLIPPFIIGLALLVVTALLEPAPRRGLVMVVVTQSLAFLPCAVALVIRALARVPLEMEQAAEILGASGTTIMRRVTLGLAGPGLVRAGLVIVGLCLGDVATPWLVGGDTRLLSTEIVARATADGQGAAAAALVLAVLAAMVAWPAGAWPSLVGVLREQPALSRLDRSAPAVLRWALAAIAWLLAVVLIALWVLVPLGALLGPAVGSPGSLGTLADVAVLRALGDSVLLGLGVALAGTALALLTAWVVEGSTGAWGRAVALVVWIPVLVSGVAAGEGYRLVAGRLSPGDLTALLLVAIVACWELPVAVRVARDVRARMDRSMAEAAVSLGAGRATTLARVVVPALRSVTGWLFGSLFATAVLAVSTVIVVAGPERELGALTMLRLAAAGATGAACAVATVLLALAGGALLLGRTLAGRQRGSTLQA